MVDIVEVTDHDDQVDISVQFNCSVRYMTHLPASEGVEIRVQLQPLPDCGMRPGSADRQRAPTDLRRSGDLVTAVRVDGDVPGQITLVFDFRKSEQFVIAQGVDPRGMRLRLIDRGTRRGKDAAQAAHGLGQQFRHQPGLATQAFRSEGRGAGAREAAGSRVHLRNAVDGEKWYRLRVGPIEQRAEANGCWKRLCRNTRARGWRSATMSMTSDPNASSAEPLPAVERIGSDPPLDPTTIKIDAGRRSESAMSARDYPTAIRLLTKLQRQPEFPERAHVQELLGLARERSGQLAHAKAEYEEYLRRYPNGEAAERIALRLRILRAASAKSQSGCAESARLERDGSSTAAFPQLFRYDGTRVRQYDACRQRSPRKHCRPQLDANDDTEDALFNDVDFLARRHGDEVDWMAR